VVGVLPGGRSQVRVQAECRRFESSPPRSFLPAVGFEPATSHPTSVAKSTTSQKSVLSRSRGAYQNFFLNLLDFDFVEAPGGSPGPGGRHRLGAERKAARRCMAVVNSCFGFEPSPLNGEISQQVVGASIPPGRGAPSPRGGQEVAPKDRLFPLAARRGVRTW
jgi:hypothetical protein